MNLSLPVKRRTKIRYSTGVGMPPINSSFDQSIFSKLVDTADSNIRQNAPKPAADINRVSSTAPLTKRRSRERYATEKETSAVARNKPEYIVKLRFIIYYRI